MLDQGSWNITLDEKIIDLVTLSQDSLDSGNLENGVNLLLGSFLEWNKWLILRRDESLEYPLVEQKANGGTYIGINVLCMFWKN